MRLLLAILVAFAATLVTQSPAQALDARAKARPTQKQVKLAKNLPKTLVVRVNNSTGQVEVFHSMKKLGKRPIHQMGFTEPNFTPVDMNNAGLQPNFFGWLFSFLGGSYFYPRYSYYGYNYDYYNYYSYPYYDYSYYYYSWPYYY